MQVHRNLESVSFRWVTCKLGLKQGRDGRQLARDFVTDCPLWPNWASAVLGMGMPLPPGRLLHTLHVTDSLMSLFIKDVFLQPILDFGSLLAWIKELDGCAF